MSFSALLGKITKDKKLEEKAKLIQSTTKTPKQTTNTTSSKRTPSLSLSALSTLSYPQDNDPAVSRLKEARRLEKEKQNAIKNAKYGTKLGSTKQKQHTHRQSQQQQQQQQQQQKQRQTKSSSPPLPPPPQKSRFKFKPLKHNLKLTTSDTQNKPSTHISFSQLMEEASKIEKPLTATTTFHFTKKQHQQHQNQPSKAYQSLQKSRSRQTDPSPRTKSSSSSSSPAPQQQHQKQMDSPARPTFAKPNPELLKRLQKKSQSKSQPQPLAKHKQAQFAKVKSKSDSYDIDAYDEDDDIEGYDNYDYDDYEDDGFIVDDDDDNEEYENSARQRQVANMKSMGYSKDEIWSIFNRGRKRNYQDYQDFDDYSDMEATGTEILEEEDRTLKAAKLDDLREQKLLEQKAREKRMKLNRL